jgi:transposase
VSKQSIPLAAVIGIDWADQHHDISLQESGSATVEALRLPHTPEALTAWLVGLRARFGGKPVGIAVETSRGPLIHALLDYEFIVLYPVNPRSLQRFREAFFPSGAKDDGPDANLLREMLLKHRDRLRAWEADDVETRTLRRLVQDRRRLVDLKTKLVQHLTAALKEYFPQALSWAGEDLSGPMASAFLLRWPTLEALQRARPQQVRKFFYAHNCRRDELIEQRLGEIAAATPLTRDAAVIATSVLLVQTLVRQLQALTPSLACFEREIEGRFAAHPDADLFRSLPGSGPALSPRLLVIFGADRSRFESADEIQRLSGIAPVTRGSGKSRSVHWRWAAPKFVRQSLHEFAHHSIRYSAWARAYYDQQRARGHGHHAAVRALAFKWIRIIYRCWQQRTPYDEKTYVRALLHRGSPLAHKLAPHAEAA